MTKYTNSFATSENLILVLIFSMSSWILEFLRLYMVFYAFNVEISFVFIVIILLFADVIGIISLLPGGIGSTEITLTGLFMLFGVSQTLAGSIALTDRLISFWMISMLGIIFSSYYSKDILSEIKSFTLDIGVLKKK